MGPANSALRIAPGLANPWKAQGGARSAVRRAFRLASVLCLSVSLTSCSAHAIPAQHAPKPSVQRPAPGKLVKRQPQPFAVADDDSPIAPVIVSLVRKIYAAATHSDYTRLEQLLKNNCPYLATVPDTQIDQIKLWHRPGVLREMIALLLTHGALTDGYTYPGFALAGFQTAYDYEDAALLHVKAPRIPTMTPTYRGPTIEIGDEPPEYRITWCGIENYPK